ncbi:RAB6A-GEF complex partner protein 1 [Lachnellula cervina]|uniref:RAB6A-GEF complex partner protein 1 n=1 Tax=Lachnellula cervina TaxID=1316786 RepID=A0A7D8YV52_9HELO|nr:RAB6A-GEF complex partner protein 1 [Lachnellula cervina]
MYWPIGAPRIYAASNIKAAKERIFEFDDDAESRETTEGSGSLVDAPSAVAEDREHDELQSSIPIPSTPITPGIKPVEHASEQNLSTRLSSRDASFSRSADTEPLLALRISRTGHLFAVITSTSMTIWQTKPTAILAVVVRSRKSLNTYGSNVSLLVRPDSAIFVVQTTHGYLITYTLATDPDARVYRPRFSSYTNGHTRRQSNFTGTRNQGGRNQGGDRILWGPGEGGGVREVSVRFRMVIKVDAGIGKALALDEELVVATKKPAAVQCIRWTPDSAGNQTSTELFSRMEWLPKKTNVTEMIHDRPMNLSCWITSDGKAYAVQRLPQSRTADGPQRLFRGYCFHTPQSTDLSATYASINARFSLIAIGCADGTIQIYTARDYVGNIPSSHIHKASVSRQSSGPLTCLTYSPDGYCLFAGYENGWATWSVFGKPGATSFGIDQRISRDHEEGWLDGVKEATWLGGGSEILIIGNQDDRIWTVEMARSAITGCYTSANISRTLLQTTSSIMVYRGYDLPDLTTISAEASLWHTAQIPSSYLVDQWPIRSSVISSDGRYVAVAGRRGLAHYSINSGRWKTFVNENMENEFQVRGGMCWYQHILVAAVEAGDFFELRLYSREAALDNSLVLHIESLPSPVVLVAPSGEDSLLVYTYDNLLYHYIITATADTVKLIQVGQIAFHGIVRSPARVRGLSWILPDDQLLDGDPSQDVAVATVLFLVDGKLVLLQPSLDGEQKLKYDMRIIAQNVEYYALMRDLPFASPPRDSEELLTEFNGDQVGTEEGNGLRDSLWTFEGTDMKVWTDVQDVLRSAPTELGRELPPTVSIPIDFYPLSVLLGKGILLGLEPDLVQRRDVNFSFFKFTIRTHLFIPQVLRFHLSRFDSSSALHLAQQYQQLEYFAHSLEILLHNVLDEEVDTSPTPETALLPGVLSFLSSFPQYLDIVVQCTRKTEVRSWRTLFTYLPPPQELFEESLARGSLKTAGGYLLILHTFEELSSSSEQLVRLLSRAKDEGDWELCKELARFLTALDESGATLMEALEMVNLRSPRDERETSSFMFEGTRLKVPRPPRRAVQSLNGSRSSDDEQSSNSSRSPLSGGPADYFSSVSGDDEQ